MKSVVGQPILRSGYPQSWCFEYINLTSKTIILMKEKLRKIFRPILDLFESGEDDYAYRKSHRKILIFIGVMFLFLSSGSFYVTIMASEIGGIIPAIVFLLIGFVCMLVAFLGSNRAVAKIWRNK